MAQSKSFQFRNFTPYKISSNKYENSISKPAFLQPKINSHKGCHHEVNFGKYRVPEGQISETWYDLANKGEFGYIDWCLKTDKIQLHATTIPHAQTALLSKQDPNAKWTKSVSRSSTEKGVQIVTYTAKVNGEDIVGPEIRELECNNCQVFKNTEHYNVSKDTCTDCMKKYTSQNF
jgi:hypothetical protein